MVVYHSDIKTKWISGYFCSIKDFIIRRHIDTDLVKTIRHVERNDVDIAKVCVSVILCIRHWAAICKSQSWIL